MITPTKAAWALTHSANLTPDVIRALARVASQEPWAAGHLLTDAPDDVWDALSREPDLLHTPVRMATRDAQWARAS